MLANILFFFSFLNVYSIIGIRGQKSKNVIFLLSAEFLAYFSSLIQRPRLCFLLHLCNDFFLDQLGIISNGSILICHYCCEHRNSQTCVYLLFKNLCRAQIVNQGFNRSFLPLWALPCTTLVFSAGPLETDRF
jgi:hypothetical protein